MAVDYSWLGAEHIWAGPDHFSSLWDFCCSLGGTERLIYTVTAFTLGHSVTLAMVTLGVFDYPVSLVEFMIALSIYVLAVELARGDKGGTYGGSLNWLAGGFGLLHGMGFAGALAGTRFTAVNVPLTRFFNVGIELGQLAFILADAACGVWQSALWASYRYVKAVTRLCARWTFGHVVH